MPKFYSFLSILLISSVASADLIKVSKEGETLASSEAQWSCVLDDKTNLYWEVKSAEKGLQYSNNTYTWFDGESGEEYGEYSHHCSWGFRCNTLTYAKFINEESLCSFSDWRLPTNEELKTLIDYYGDADVMIDLVFFPNTQPASYWTSTAVENSGSIVYEVPFVYGGTVARDKYFDTYVRLVRSGAE